MRDLTKDSIEVHILLLAAPVAVNMLTGMAYQLIDLYFITSLGAQATAGVNAASNIMFAVGALAQVLAVGATPLIAQAVGARDQSHANLIFNQSLVLGAVAGAAIIVLLYALTGPYMRAVAADAASAQAGNEFMAWLTPGLGLMLVSTSLGSALRSMGVVKAYMVIPAITIIVNALLAPILIAGWGTGIALGARGAGLATTLATALGLLLLFIHFQRSERYLALNRAMLWPRLEHWRRMISIGLPAGAELILTFVSTAAVYYVIRDFGPAAQAGFGIGSRVLQVVLMAGLAIGFAVAPIAAQNFGAGNAARVRETFYKASLMSSGVMIVTSVVVAWQADALAGVFDTDAAAAEIATRFLQLMSWTFVAQGLVYVCTYMFQGLGNTMPSLLTSALRFLIIGVGVIWLSTRVQFDTERVWYLLSASVVVQALLGLWLMKVELERNLTVLVPGQRPAST